MEIFWRPQQKITYEARRTSGDQTITLRLELSGIAPPEAVEIIRKLDPPLPGKTILDP